MVVCVVPNFIATKRMVLAGRNLSENISWIKFMKTNQSTTLQFAICVENSEYPASLELLKVYQVIPDKEAEQTNDLRVIDESGEDYLFPADYFVLINLPTDAAQTLHQSFRQAVQPAR